MDDESRLIRNFTFWLKATTIALACHGFVLMVAAGMVFATGFRVAERLAELIGFLKDQTRIMWGG